MKISSIEKLERRNTNIGIIVVVLRKLSKGKAGFPTPTEIDNVSPQHILECLNGSLTVSISMRVRSHAEEESRTHLLVKL